MNKVLEEDLLNLIKLDFIEWNKLNNKKIFITGATGLIGSILVKSILLKNKLENYNIKLLLLVRNKNKAMDTFGKSQFIEYAESSVENCRDIKDIDYIIHAASPTKSKFLSENPVETLNTSVIGTKNILEIAKKNNVRSMVYLSSMEMYGTIEDNNVTEEKLGLINLQSTRSSYPEAKRVCELYCYSYFKEYNVPVKIARLAQTFGPGISRNENRVYKMFADCIIKKNDIILKSTGETKINYCYTTDAISAILLLLTSQENGESFNVVSDSLNMTILESAKWLIKEYGHNKMQVIFDENEKCSAFAPNNYMILSNEKIKKIGWRQRYSLKDGYARLLKFLEEEYKNEE